MPLVMDMMATFIVVSKRVKGKFGHALEVGGVTCILVPADDKLKLTAYTVTIWLNTKSSCKVGVGFYQNL